MPTPRPARSLEPNRIGHNAATSSDPSRIQRRSPSPRLGLAGTFERSVRRIRIGLGHIAGRFSPTLRSRIRLRSSFPRPAPRSERPSRRMTDGLRHVAGGYLSNASRIPRRSISPRSGLDMSTPRGPRLSMRSQSSSKIPQAPHSRGIGPATQISLPGTRVPEPLAPARHRNMPGAGCRVHRHLRTRNCSDCAEIWDRRNGRTG